MNKTPTAWMLRRDGIAFPCQWHYKARRPGGGAWT